MARVWVKICGLRTHDALEAAVAGGADAVGFVFHAGSPRNLSFDEARSLARAVPPAVERVAVFLHPTQPLVDGAIDAVAPDWVQTDLADLAQLNLPAGQPVLPVLRSAAAAPLPARCLFEAARSGMGERAEWGEAARLAARTELVLAGGLDAGNVTEAIRVVRPFGVDVSSGVESSRGVKDAAKILAFIRAARGARPAGIVEESGR